MRKGAGAPAPAPPLLLPPETLPPAPSLVTRGARSAPYLTNGAMISAKAVRARFSRDFTVPRFTPVMSAISS
jgi:hypothetical protein